MALRMEGTENFFVSSGEEGLGGLGVEVIRVIAASLPLDG